jgi:tetratricopeptide (TPR) repeat protein
LVKKHPRRAVYRTELVEALTSQAGERMELARYQDAERAFRRALGLARRLAADAPGSPAAVGLLARTASAYSYLVREWGRYARSAEVLREVIAHLEALRAAHPDRPHYWRMLPTAYRNLAQPLDYLHDSAGERAALQAADRLEVLLAKLPGPDRPLVTDEDRLLGSLHLKDFDRLATQQGEADRVCRQAEQRAQAHPDVPVYQVALARAKVLTALRLLSGGAPAQVGPPLRDALAVLGKLAADHPDVPRYRHGLGDATVHCGTIYLLAGDAAEGQRCVRAGLDVLAKLADEYPKAPAFRYAHGQATVRVLMLKHSQGRAREAIRYEADGLAVLKRLAAEFPSCPEYRRQSAQGCITLGIHLSALGEAAQAEAAFHEGARLWARTAADFPSTHEFRLAWGSACASLGHFLSHHNKPREAEEAFGRAIRIHERVVAEFPRAAEHHFALATDHIWQAGLRESQKRLPAARQSYAHSIACLERAVRIEPRRRDWLANLQQVLRHRALLSQALDNGDDYRRDLRRSEEVGERLSPPLVRLSRAGELAGKGDLARARAEADDLFLDDLAGYEWYELAVLYARLSGSARGAPGKGGAAARAVESLSKAIEKGYIGSVPPAEDSRFRRLARRADFKKLAGAAPR